MSRTILITNDDGIHADGMLRLARAAVRFGDVWLIAPRRQRSASSHTITLQEPLDLMPFPYEAEGVRAYTCSGTPADCVRIGAGKIMPCPPDVVLSGINYGYNAATDIQYSATAGAAFEASFLGFRGIALSEYNCPCHEVTDHYLDEILEELIDQDPGPDRIWNVNFPGCPLSECTGILRDRVMSHEIVYKDSFEPVEVLNGVGMRFVVRGTLQHKAEEGTDFDALLQNAVSVGKVKNIC